MEEPTEEDTLELTQYSDGFSDTAKQVAEMMATKALSELQEAGEVSFNPLQDAAELDAIKSASLFRLAQVARLDIREELNAQRRRKAQLLQGDEAKEIVLEDEEPPLQEIIALEKDLSKIVSTHSDTIKKCMKEKRMLSGQLYGSQGSQGQNLSRAATMQRVVAKGRKGLEALSAAGHLGFTPNDELELSNTPPPAQTAQKKTQVVELPDYSPNENFDPVNTILGNTELPPVIPEDDDDDIYCEDY